LELVGKTSYLQPPNLSLEQSNGLDTNQHNLVKDSLEMFLMNPQHPFYHDGKSWL